MKLTNVQVKEFRSVWDSNPFDIGQITALVGKNESGKTTTLQALYRLNPIIEEEGKFDVTEDYPRLNVEDYEQAISSKSRLHAQVVTATFELDETELAAVRKSFGQGALKTPHVIITKGYDNFAHHQLPVDESAIVKSCAASAGLPPDAVQEASKMGSVAEFVEFLNTRATSLEKVVSAALAVAANIPDESQKAKAQEEARKLGESSLAKQWRDWLSKVMTTGVEEYIWKEFVEKRVPKFLYFDEYYQMQGAINIQQLKERQSQKKLIPSDRPMLGLVELARLNLDQLVSPQRTEFLLNKLEGASNHLSGKILKYWSQNRHIQLRFDVRPALPEDPVGFQNGTNLWGRVFDSVHQVSTPLGRRSRGFIWFFSFLAWYSQQKKEGSSIILLLDEPGLFLHASAQADLLRYIDEELKPHHQVLYSTHSPFMIDPKEFSRVRVVEDKSMDAEAELPLAEQGTKVSQDVLDVSAGTLFPLQGALGYDIAQTLFVGPNSLIVEGVSDLLYLPIVSSALEALGRTGLSDKWTITPVGGSDKVATFVALMGSQRKLNIAALIDIQNKDRQSIENIYKRKLLKKNHVMTYADFTGEAEADVEDMFDPEFYLSLVSGAYLKELGEETLTLSKLPKGGDRIVPRVEALFSAKGLSLNHFRPARFLAEHPKLLTKLSVDSLSRWEKAFMAANSLLKT